MTTNRVSKANSALKDPDFIGQESSFISSESEDDPKFSNKTFYNVDTILKPRENIF